jgi:hypothetical protein
MVLVVSIDMNATWGVPWDLSFKRNHAIAAFILSKPTALEPTPYAQAQVSVKIFMKD